jgi:O-Antigen ligase
MNPSIASKDTLGLVAAVTAVAATIATFAKSFVPFYLVGSTAFFVFACFVAIVLIAVRWREILDNASYATNILVLLAIFYGIVVANFILKSSGQVSFTYLVGILAFHGVFFLFGFCAARGLKWVFAILLAQAAVFLIYILEYTFRFGDPMSQGHLEDVFGVGDPSLYIAFHLYIGTALGIAVLAALGIARDSLRLVVYAAIAVVLWFMFHIASRTALVALICSLAFLMWAALWVRSKRSAILLVALLGILMLAISGVFYRFAVNGPVDPTSPDAISRTIREIKSDNPGFRLPIWQRTWHRIATEPDHLLFGRGIGSFSIDEGLGPPTWLLDKSRKHYPHNIHLEMLYETGIAGFLIFALITFFPLIAALRLWGELSPQAKAAISIYVFYLVTGEISGSFAYNYDFQFFFGLASGLVAFRYKELAAGDEVNLMSSITPRHRQDPGLTSQEPS